MSVLVAFAVFNHEPVEAPMTGTDMTLIALLQQHDEGDFLRAATEALLRTPMQHDVEGVIGAGRQSVATVGRPAGTATVIAT